MTIYNFDSLAEQIIDALVKGAEDQVTEATNLLAATKALAEGIRAQTKEHSRMLNDMDARLRMLGESMLTAQNKFLNGAQATAAKIGQHVEENDKAAQA